MQRLLILVLAVGLAACSERPLQPSNIGDASGPAADTSFSTEVFVGAGDIGRCGSPGHEATARLLDRQPGTVFTTGDNAYPSGRPEDFRDCYNPTWGRHRARTRPVPGNHDYETPGASGYFGYFGSNAGPAGLGYYAYTLGAWRIIALNSEVLASAGSAQAAWLRSELQSTPTQCTAAYWHRPLFSSGPHGDNQDMRDLFRLLYDAGVEFVVTGHDHLYERFARLDPDGRTDQARGIRQFTVGTGGGEINQPVFTKPSSAVIGTSWGVIRFELSPGSYRWQFLPVDGQAFQDSGFETCH